MSRTSDLDQTLLPFQRQLAWAAASKGGKIATDAMAWLEAHPEPILEEVPIEGVETDDSRRTQGMVG